MASEKKIYTKEVIDRKSTPIKNPVQILQISKVRCLTYLIRYGLILFLKQEISQLKKGKINFDLKRYITSACSIFKSYKEFKPYKRDEVQTALNSIFNLTEMPIEDFDQDPYVRLTYSDFKQINTYLSSNIHPTKAERVLIDIEEEPIHLEFMLGAQNSDSDD